ncbi:Uncharacterized protein TCM_015673 [Theobroma cacao]|uniref:Yippee domain-containing protein n=1 Tax=Theobroma cacao TaxID=3641 RepID=A0A061G3E1_THECC|nr:Uncharacterized protein TCM_015673 [Theobroma cacao]
MFECRIGDLKNPAFKMVIHICLVVTAVGITFVHKAKTLARGRITPSVATAPYERAYSRREIPTGFMVDETFPLGLTVDEKFLPGLWWMRHSHRVDGRQGIPTTEAYVPVTVQGWDVTFCKMASHGRAFLFTHVQNVVDGPEEDRQLIIGLYTVTDVYCSDCGELLGWSQCLIFSVFLSYTLVLKIDFKPPFDYPSTGTASPFGEFSVSRNCKTSMACPWDSVLTSDPAVIFAKDIVSDQESHASVVSEILVEETSTKNARSTEAADSNINGISKDFGGCISEQDLQDTYCDECNSRRNDSSAEECIPVNEFVKSSGFS